MAVRQVQRPYGVVRCVLVVAGWGRLCSVLDVRDIGLHCGAGIGDLFAVFHVFEKGCLQVLDNREFVNGPLLASGRTARSARSERNSVEPTRNKASTRPTGIRPLRRRFGRLMLPGGLWRQSLMLMGR